MIRLLKYKFKNNLLSRTNILTTIIMIIVIISICGIIKSYQTSTLLYKVAVIDNDNTPTSSELIDDIIAYKQIDVTIEEDKEKSMIKLSRGNYDVVYEIKDGFEDKIKKGKFDNILVANKESTSLGVKWVNDKVSLIVLRRWMFSDIYKRIQKVSKDYDREKLEQRFLEDSDKTILDVIIHNVNDGKVVEIKNDDKKIYKIIWASVILFIIINIGKEIIDDRNNGVITRLEFAGINKIQYYSSYIIYIVIDIIVPFIITYFTLGYFTSINSFVIDIFITLMYICSTWIILIIITKLFKTKKGYILCLQLYFLISIILGTGILNQAFKLVDNISKFIPMYWYIHI
ncbi:ABC transporter permease [Clostridiaceae bacterium M8S5]|nr:ABC transporter permease [Clostridiaceae bacterium M8S5]